MGALSQIGSDAPSSCKRCANRLQSRRLMAHLRRIRAQLPCSICPKQTFDCSEAEVWNALKQSAQRSTCKMLPVKCLAIPWPIPLRCTAWQMPQHKSPRYAESPQVQNGIETRKEMYDVAARSYTVLEGRCSGHATRLSNLFKRARTPTGDRKKAVIDEAIRLLEQLSSDGKIAGLAQVNGQIDGET